MTKSRGVGESKPRTTNDALREKVVVLVVTLTTVLTNVAFLLTGFTQQLSCTLKEASEDLTAIAHAAFYD